MWFMQWLLRGTSLNSQIDTVKVLSSITDLSETVKNYDVIIFVLVFRFVLCSFLISIRYITWWGSGGL